MRNFPRGGTPWRTAPSRNIAHAKPAPDFLGCRRLCPLKVETRYFERSRTTHFGTRKRGGWYSDASTIPVSEVTPARGSPDSVRERAARRWRVCRELQERSVGGASPGFWARNFLAAPRTCTTKTASPTAVKSLDPVVLSSPGNRRSRLRAALGGFVSGGHSDH